MTSPDSIRDNEIFTDHNVVDEARKFCVYSLLKANPGLVGSELDGVVGNIAIFSNPSGEGLFVKLSDDSPLVTGKCKKDEADNITGPNPSHKKEIPNRLQDDQIPKGINGWLKDTFMLDPVMPVSSQLVDEMKYISKSTSAGVHNFKNATSNVFDGTRDFVAKPLVKIAAVAVLTSVGVSVLIDKADHYDKTRDEQIALNRQDVKTNFQNEFSIDFVGNNVVFHLPGDPLKDRIDNNYVKEEIAKLAGLSPKNVEFSGNNIILPSSISDRRLINVSASVYSYSHKSNTDSADTLTSTTLKIDGSTLASTTTTETSQVSTSTTIALVEPATTEKPVSPEVPALAEVTTSPEIAKLNQELDLININKESNNLTGLIQAVKDSYNAFRPNDKDRPDTLPQDYVKAMLPNEAVGINIPFTVASKTANVERYGSAEMVAFIYATAKLYQDLINTKYPNLAGEMLRIRDLSSPVHSSHNYGRMVDLSGSLGFGITGASTGSFADYTLSPRFDKAFTEDMLVAMGKLTDDNGELVKFIISSGQTMGPEVNNRAGRQLVKSDGKKKEHGDHVHIGLVERTELPASGLRVSKNMPWTTEEDLWIGDRYKELTPEEFASQHSDFENWINQQKIAIQPKLNDAPVYPAVDEKALINDDSSKIIDGLDISKDQKDFMKNLLPAIVSVSQTAKINPAVVFSQACIETSFGNDNLSRQANNFFGIKAGKDWSGETVVLPTIEYKNGKKIIVDATFRKYKSMEDSIADYAHSVIENRSWFADSAANAGDLDKYLAGLFNKLDDNGNIVTGADEPKYATDPNYELKIKDFIAKSKVVDLIANQSKSPDVNVNAVGAPVGNEKAGKTVTQIWKK